MGRLRGRSGLLAGLLILLFFAACRTTNPVSMDASVGADEPSRTETANVHIRKITYSSVEGGTSVRIYSTGKLEYTSYKLSDPFRLAVEIPDVVLDFKPKRIKMNNADISSLSVVRFPKINSVRIELGLFSNVPFSISSNSRYMEIVVSHESGKKPDEVAAVTDVDAAPVDVANKAGSLEETPEKLREENEKLTTGNLQSQKETQELREENMLLEQRLEDALAQLEKSEGMTKALKARSGFMEKKLRELQAMPRLLPAPDVKTSLPLPLPSPTLMEFEKETPKNADADSMQAIDEIKKMLDSWLTAWNWKDLLKYSGYYASDFKAGNMDRNKWLKYKGQKFTKPGAIEVKVKGVKIEILDSQNAVAVFEQAFRSSLHRDKGIKTLTLVKKIAGWQIISESWKTL